MAHERICMMCGTKYEYCSHCNDFNAHEMWRYLYHDENCKNIGDIWYAYRGKEISKEEAKARMSEYKPNIDAVLKYTSIAANEIRDIFDIKEEVPTLEDEEQKEEIIEEVAETKSEPENVSHPDSGRIHKNKHK